MSVESSLAGASLDEFNRSGFAIVKRVLSPTHVAGLIEATCAYASGGHDGALDRRGELYGGRDLLWRVPAVSSLAHSPEVLAPIQAILGPAAFPVRGLFFDKPPGHSWALPWHRDLTVAVKAHGIIGKFRRPTIKAAVPHMEAPIDLLETMLTARIHLDDMTDANGPLRVLPGSHMSRESKMSDDRSATSIHCRAGDVLLMRPLLYHASASGEPRSMQPLAN